MSNELPSYIIETFSISSHNEGPGPSKSIIGKVDKNNQEVRNSAGKVITEDFYVESQEGKNHGLPSQVPKKSTIINLLFIA